MNPVTLQSRSDVSLLTNQDLLPVQRGQPLPHLRQAGRASDDRRWEGGTCFGVWAPNAREVSVIGDFNGWDGRAHKLTPRGNSGIWEGFVPGLGKGTLYKFHIVSQQRTYRRQGRSVWSHHENPPRTASVVWDLNYEWADSEWMASRIHKQSLHAPDVDLRSPPGLMDAHPGR